MRGQSVGRRPWAGGIDVDRAPRDRSGPRKPRQIPDIVRPSSMTSTPFLIVGIGASAGGIPAFEGFFHEMPDDTGMAIVLVTHLSPFRKSLLHEVIARYTSTPVEVVEDGVTVAPGRIYVMPEGRILTIAEGRLRLHDDDVQHRERKPIDVFFASLAEDQGERAVGIVLSGGDGDGTLGVKAIKQHGGITMAQAHDGNGPRNPEMPDSAIASGLIDFDVPVEAMPRCLMQIRDGVDVADVLSTPEGPQGADSIQTEIAGLLRRHAGHDFSGYKNRTFLRRVARRMKVVNHHTIDAYLTRLRDDPGEVSALFRDLLINVTSFFRDTDAFDALTSQVIPPSVRGPRRARDAADLGPGLLYRRGGLFACHPDARTHGRHGGRPRSADLRHRHRRGSAVRRSCRSLPRRAAGRRRSAPPVEVLPQRRRQPAGRQGGCARCASSRRTR